MYAVTLWRTHRQVKKCIVNFNSILNISLIRRTSLNLYVTNLYQQNRCFVIKTWISNLVLTIRFWNNFDLVLSATIFKPNKSILCNVIEDYLYLLLPLFVCVGGGGVRGRDQYQYLNFFNLM